VVKCLCQTGKGDIQHWSAVSTDDECHEQYPGL